MIAGDPAPKACFHWTREHKAIVRRGAGPTEGSVCTRSGERPLASIC